MLDCPAIVALVGRIQYRVREGGLWSPEESGLSLEIQCEGSGDRG